MLKIFVLIVFISQYALAFNPRVNGVSIEQQIRLRVEELTQGENKTEGELQFYYTTFMNNYKHNKALIQRLGYPKKAKRAHLVNSIKNLRKDLRELQNRLIQEQDVQGTGKPEILTIEFLNNEIERLNSRINENQKELDLLSVKKKPEPIPFEYELRAEEVREGMLRPLAPQSALNRSVPKKSARSRHSDEYIAFSKKVADSKWYLQKRLKLHKAEKNPLQRRKLKKSIKKLQVNLLKMQEELDRLRIDPSDIPVAPDSAFPDLDPPSSNPFSGNTASLNSGGFPELPRTRPLLESDASSLLNTAQLPTTLGLALNTLQNPKPCSLEPAIVKKIKRGNQEKQKRKEKVSKPTLGPEIALDWRPYQNLLNLSFDGITFSPCLNINFIPPRNTDFIDVDDLEIPPLRSPDNPQR